MAHYCLNEDLMFIADWTVVFFWVHARALEPTVS
jgi:hypothetical protein